VAASLDRRRRQQASATHDGPTGIGRHPEIQRPFLDWNVRLSMDPIDPHRPPGRETRPDGPTLESRMRSAALLMLSLLAAGVPAMAGEGVPFETLSWTSDSAAPTETGLARRVQAYFLINMDEEAGKGLYWNLRGGFGQKYEHNYRIACQLIGCNGDVPIKNENETETWCKAVDQSGALVRTFAGDATAALVVVDATGRIVQISRLGTSNDQERKSIEALFPAAQPLIDNDGLFPLACKGALKWLKLGDVKHAIKDLQKLGPNGTDLLKAITEQASRLIGDDAKLLADDSATASTRFIALQRVTRLMGEFPGTPAEPAAAKAIRASRSDKPLATEAAAWAMLQEYLQAMKKTPAKKVADLQRQWLPMITAKAGGTYAAEVATMIRRAARLDQEETVKAK
jgi:hypothetical protein